MWNEEKHLIFIGRTIRSEIEKCHSKLQLSDISFINLFTK
jgi:aminoglycoside phosphotransferase family enzyme